MERLRRILHHVQPAQNHANDVLAMQPVNGTDSPRSPSMKETYTTADVCDELDGRAYVVPIAFQQFGTRHAFHGIAYTIEAYGDNSMVRRVLEAAAAQAKGALPASASSSSSSSSSSATPNLPSSTSNHVLVIDGDAYRGCALLGDQMVGLLRAGGWRGAIVNGCVRDVDVWRDWPVGVVAIGTCPRRSKKEGRGKAQVSVTLLGLGGVAVGRVAAERERERGKREQGGAVNVSSVTIRPGDMVYVDGDGVVVVPNRSDSGG